MAPNFIICQTWTLVKEALILEFDSSQALSSHNQAFVAIQFKYEDSDSVFGEKFYWEVQVLVTCGKLSMDDAITAAVSSVASHPHLQLYIKASSAHFLSIKETKEALLDIPPNLLLTSSLDPKPASASLSCVATVLPTASTKGSSSLATKSSRDKSTQ